MGHYILLLWNAVCLTWRWWSWQRSRAGTACAKGGRAVFHRDYDITENREPWHQTRPALFTKGSSRSRLKFQNAGELRATCPWDESERDAGLFGRFHYSGWLCASWRTAAEMNGNANGWLCRDSWLRLSPGRPVCILQLNLWSSFSVSGQSCSHLGCAPSAGAWSDNRIIY